jgi:hypothetical protein
MAAQQQDFIVKNGMVVRNTATISTIDNFVGTSTNIIVGQPTLNLDFTKGVLDNRITFARASNATYVGPDGYIKTAGINQPRFDYSSTSTGTIIGLLIEEQRVNYYTSSTDYFSSLSYVFWDGSLGFRKNSLAITTNTNYALSIYIKVNAYTSGITIALDLGDGPTTATAPLSSFPPGVWTRLSGTGTEGPSGTFADIRLQGLPASYTLGVTYTGPGPAGSTCPMTRNYGMSPDGQRTSTRIVVVNTTTGSTISDIEVWGYQVEAGQFPTSFIPTAATGVTRATETASIMGSNFTPWFNQNVGTWFAEFDTGWTGSAVMPSSSPGVLGITDSTYSGIYSGFNGHGLQATMNATGSNIRYSDRNGNAAAGNATAAVSMNTYLQAGTIYKGAGAYDFGVLVCTARSQAVNTVTTPWAGILSFNKLLIGSQNVGGNSPLSLHGHVRKIQYWPYRLTNVQMQAITSSTTYTGNNFANVDTPSPRTANTSDFVVQQGVQIRSNLEVPDVDKYYVTTLSRPTQPPSLNLNFLKATLDPRIQFTRSSGATYVGADGLIKYASANTARFNYSSTSTGTCLGLLIEEQRTNLLPFSTDLVSFAGNAYPNDYVATNNVTVSPDGTCNAGFILKPAYNGSSIVYKTFVGSINTTYIATLWLKAGGYSRAQVTFGNSAFGNISRGANFNLLTGSVISTLNTATDKVSITQYPNGWWKTTVTAVSSGTGGSYVFGFTPLDNSNNSVFTGDGVSGIYAWGAQVEASTFATSYIPTAGASATRAAETAVISGQNFANFYNPTQGTIYAEGYTSPGFPGFAPVTTITDSSFINNYIGQYQYTGLMGATIRWGTNIQLGDPDAGTPTNTGTLFRLATTINSGNYYSVANSAVSGSVTDPRVPTSVDRIYIGSANGGWINSTLRRVIYYPKVLSTATLQVLTSSTYI